MRTRSFALLLLACTSCVCGVRFVVGAEQAKPAQPASAVSDPRHISNGWNIPSEGYADQPYLVKTDDGAWLCAMTTGKGAEGGAGQHVVAMRSTDQGRTWEKPVDIEPGDGPAASYAVLLKVPYGRVYVFYNHNTDRVTEVKREDKGAYQRVDSLGHYVFKYSDDHGRTWSAKRYDVPVREFECDRKNAYGGNLRFFWNVGRPLILGDAAIMVLHKVGAMGEGFFAQSEGAFLKSRSILSERNPENITFETLPDGDVGLRTPPGGGRVAEEQSISALSDGSLYCVYRTTDGWPACAYSRDGGHTWTQPAYAAYTPGGRRIKHPRAANFAWRCANGKFLYWFHNHGGARLAQRRRALGEGIPYEDRNPAWLAAGHEVDSPSGKVIHWSQPEILLYDDDPYIRISYPDLVEDGGKFFVTETQKNIGRVHEISKPLLDGLFSQFDNKQVATDGLAMDLSAPAALKPQVSMPKLPEFGRRDYKRPDHGGEDLRAGFSLDLWLQLDSLAPGQVILDSRDESGAGILVSTTEAGTVEITLNDGRQQASWDSDGGTIKPGRLHHVVISVDGGPKVITFVVDGVLCDGGDRRQFGWGRFSPTLRAPNGSLTLKIAPSVRSLRLYRRALRTSEAVGNFHAGQLPSAVIRRPVPEAIAASIPSKGGGVSEASIETTPAQGAGYQWTRVESSAPFAPRDGAGALTMGGKMWLIGGWYPQSPRQPFPRICTNEVWSSRDGKDWVLEKPNSFLDDRFDATADWEGRHTAGYVVHQGKLWIVGGDPIQGHYQSDVWNSIDGKRWTHVNPGKPVPWGPRVLHYTVAHDGWIWVIGGQTLPPLVPGEERFYRDVWRTKDGVNWDEVKPKEPFWPQRGMIGGSAVMNGRMWILGGGTYDTPNVPKRKYFNDVWSSADGVHWKQHTDHAPWAPRQYHDVAVYDDKLWVMEGFSGANRNDVWYSPDGVNWYEVPNTPWKPRHAASVFVHDGSLWIVAGNNLESDVWRLSAARAAGLGPGSATARVRAGTPP